MKILLSFALIFVFAFCNLGQIKQKSEKKSEVASTSAQLVLITDDKLSIADLQSL